MTRGAWKGPSTIPRTSVSFESQDAVWACDPECDPKLDSFPVSDLSGVTRYSGDSNQHKFPCGATNQSELLLHMDQEEKFLRAISYAIAQGAWVDVSRLDINRSSEKNGEYLLRTSGMAIIARIPLEELAKVPIADFERIRGIGPEGLRAIRKVSGASVPEVQSPAVRAVAWASAMGYPIPKRMGGCASAILVVLGLCMFVVPGVLLLVWLFVEANQYDRDMKQLIEKWVDAGRPAPGEGIKEVTRLERIVEKVDDSAPQAASTEQRLLELNSMKEKGLITEEEYQAMRKKTLDL